MKLEKEKKEKSDLLGEMEKIVKSKTEFEEEIFEKVFSFEQNLKKFIYN